MAGGRRARHTITAATTTTTAVITLYGHNVCTTKENRSCVKQNQLRNVNGRRQQNEKRNKIIIRMSVSHTHRTTVHKNIVILPYYHMPSVGRRVRAMVGACVRVRARISTGGRDCKQKSPGPAAATATAMCI